MITSDRLMARAQREADEEWEALATLALKVSLSRIIEVERTLEELRASHLILRKSIDDHTFRPFPNHRNSQ